MKKLIAGALGALLAVGMTACGSDSGNGGGTTDGGRVALIAKANSAEYWMKVKEGAEAAGKELGVEVTFNGPDTESEGDKQLNQLQTAINDKPLGIGFAPQDGAQDGAPRLMDDAQAAGIPVVVFDTPLAGSDVPLATVASDNEGMGAQAAEKLVELTGGEGKVAIIAHGEVGTAAARRDGFRDYIEQNAPGMEVVDVQNGESDPAKSRDKAQGILQAHPDLVGFFGTDDDSTIAIADEVDAKGLHIKVVGIDSSPDVLTLLTEGKIAGVIVQNPFNMGYQTVELLVNASKGEEPTEKNIVSESIWVTPDNIDSEEVQQVIG
ncbi:ribose transport system substrate-binding protein [Tessaracoccus bendigoensis DSM 12906]|uniref:Ribose transport system substrate-binding protein n=1 Tax=Tessaracoccus bendigoensis DSM 12906 TaxID=1123357 RepID=A0A1M6NCR1_9ACTN|nr:ABC transporter substrate-binding protein [Tessaracoccus bendigoensis]SHJ93394.1 ribose transport system substrate-binding protein [Tessaracoccus bendigoensis DSM 12906]